MAGYLGMSVPVLGLGILAQFVEAKVALIGFAALLLTGIATSAQTLFASRPGGRAQTVTS